MDFVRRTVWFLGNDGSSRLAAIAIADEKPSVLTTESTVVIVGLVVANVESLSTDALHL